MLIKPVLGQGFVGVNVRLLDVGSGLRGRHARAGFTWLSPPYLSSFTEAAFLSPAWVHYEDIVRHVLL